jgi:hypothetical protein
MVDMQPEDYERLEFSNFDANDFVDPAMGFSEGNRIQYGISITNTIDLIRVPSNLGGALHPQSGIVAALESPLKPGGCLLVYVQRWCVAEFYL